MTDWMNPDAKALMRGDDNDPYGVAASPDVEPRRGTLSGAVPMKPILRDGETFHRVRRIVQFSAVGRGTVEQIIVLCDDGSLWLAAPIANPLAATKWELIPEPPPCF